MVAFVRQYDRSWGLDGLGNMSSVATTGSTTQTRTANAGNEIQTLSGGITPSYDAAGNLIFAPSADGSSSPVHYVYDAWNRLVAVKADSGGSAGATLDRYTYDGLNRRVETMGQNETGWPRAVARPRLPQTRTCAINAFGSSNCHFATPRRPVCFVRRYGTG